MRRFQCLLLIAVVLNVASGQAAVPLLVGVLEHPQCKSNVKKSVRALFSKREGQWVALRSAEATRRIDLSNVTWIATVNGRSIGLLRTTDPGFDNSYAWTYPRDRLLEIPNGQSVPRVADDTKRFSGWCDAPSDRPLVVVSEPNFRDPDGWRQIQPEPSYRQVLFELFTANAGTAVICQSEEDSGAVFSYGITDLILSEAYQDNLGRKLIALRLKPELNKCDGPPEKAWWKHWFLVETTTRYVGNELELVATGDYDADGISEVIFWHSGYNEDGYTLYYDGFRKRVDYYWNYH